MVNLDDLDLLDLEAALCRRRFRAFVSLAWPHVCPDMPLRPSLAVDAIAEHLQAVAEGDITRLLINCPPGVSKSVLTCVMFPAWVLARNPSWQGIFSSYSFDLATRDSRRCRALIEGEWYQRAFVRGQWALRSDQNKQDDFATTAGGRRLALSVGGKATGERARFLAADDPLNASEAHSKPARDACIRWWDQVMSSRLNDPERDPRVIVMQRLHEDDLSGHVLAQGGYEHLMLPSEFDSRRCSITYVTRPDGERSEFWRDPREEDGQLLVPTLHTRAVLDQAKREMGSAAYAGQHLQSPVDEEGGMFPRRWWRFHKPDGTAPESSHRPRGCYEGPAVPLPGRLRYTISCDLSFKGGEHNDYAAFVVVGVAPKEPANRYVVEVVRRKMDFVAQCAAIQDLARRYRGARILVEDAANAAALVAQLKRTVPGIVPVRPEGAKEARWQAASPQVEAGNVLLKDGASWLEDFVEEHAAAPRGRNDDTCDSLAQAINHLSADASGYEWLKAAAGKNTMERALGALVDRPAWRRRRF